MRSFFTQAGANTLGADAPVYDSILRGIPPVGETVSSARPISNIWLRGMAQQESIWEQFNPATGCTKVSTDGGYGLMQITWCMKTGVNCPGIDQARVAGEWIYNLGTGAKLLIQQWNSAPIIGDNDHTVPEQWYYAVIRYNGWSTVNDPNDSQYNPGRSPFGDNNEVFVYPYQERIMGWMAHPEMVSALWRWRPTRVAAVPRGIFDWGDTSWEPPAQTPKPVFFILDGVKFANGAGSTIVLRNTTNTTLAADVALYNRDHIFNRWLRDSGSYTRLAPQATLNLPLSLVLGTSQTFDGYARINASEGIEVSLSPGPYRTFLPLIQGGGPSANLVLNGGFETFVDGKPQYWSVYSHDDYWDVDEGYTLADGTWFHSGHYGAYLGGYDNASDSLSQAVTMPSGAAQCLKLWSYVQSTEPENSSMWDKMNVVLRDIYGNGYALYTLSNQSPQKVWQSTQIDVSSYSGQSWALSLEADNDSSYPTSFFLDDISIDACGY